MRSHAQGLGRTLSFLEGHHTICCTLPGMALAFRLTSTPSPSPPRGPLGVSHPPFLSASKAAAQSSPPLTSSLWPALQALLQAGPRSSQHTPRCPPLPAHLLGLPTAFNSVHSPHLPLKVLGALFMLLAPQQRLSTPAALPSLLPTPWTPDRAIPSPLGFP